MKALPDAGPRVLDLHIKDLTDLSDRDSQVIVDQGSIPLAAIFRQLLSMNYRDAVNREYEIDARDPLPRMKESFAHMRRILAGIQSNARWYREPSSRSMGPLRGWP